MRHAGNGTGEDEFDAAMASCGVAVPAELRPGARAVYFELKRMAELVSGPRPAESEPAAVFSIQAFLHDR